MLKLTKTFKQDETETPLKQLATFTLRLAAALQSGVTPLRALQVLSAEPGRLGLVATAIAERAVETNNVVGAVAAQQDAGWRLLATALHIAKVSGAPISVTVQRLSEAFFKLDQLHRERAAALAGAKSTVVLIAAMPLLAFVVAQLLGLELLREYLTALGATMLFIGALLFLFGIVWARHMIRAQEAKDRVVGFELDLVWIAVAGGKSPVGAMRQVVDAGIEFGCEWITLDEFVAESALGRVLSTAKITGAPVRPMLLAEADAVRDEAAARLQSETQKLAVRVLLPLGLFILPAFVLSVVLPIIMSMMR